MNRNLKIAAIIIGVLILIVILIPFFIDANSFRPKLESVLSDALGRQVKVGNLSLSLFSGAVKAEDISIADDPAFSQTAFVQAKSLSVGVELMPLIFSKALNVTELTLNQPEISLVRSKDGEKWNFSSLGSANSAKKASPPRQRQAQARFQSKSFGKKAEVSEAADHKPRGFIGEAAGLRQGEYRREKLFFHQFLSFQDDGRPSRGRHSDTRWHRRAHRRQQRGAHPDASQSYVHKMNLAASGFIDPASGIAGIADFDGTVSSDGHEAKTVGTLNAEKLQVVQKGAPAGKPVQVKYSVTYDLAKQTGTITQGEIALGKAVEQISGTYDTQAARPPSI